MQRPRRPNRQSRRGNHSQNSQSNSSRGPSSSNNSSNYQPPRLKPAYTPVPAYSVIVVGNGVSIILKQDQSIGHQVQGIVAELLTRGDHPRGVKVRLRDGRVGRVQALVSEEEGVRGENIVRGTDAGLGRNGEASSSPAPGQGRGRGRGGQNFRHVQDSRDDGYMWDESRSRNLSEYFSGLDLESQDEIGGWAASERSTVPEVKSEMVKCPVCGIFEGDERAVAHHVEGHFQD
ncbi:hypothetical protein CC78DRAFT_50492 [Lojkania enalia]|uniref:UBZ4-type domain-containing protein n=1 Tax=Lojkania enalia TaxID=147567 RepID=A0A9P4N6S0_9PLEO|nr:hypothetical protein CC78DRAFT_50492 [Didymosphaeria enalia]